MQILASLDAERDFPRKKVLCPYFLIPFKITTAARARIMTQFNFTGGETQRRGWDQCDALAPNEQSEPNPKRQCMEHSWTTQGVVLDQYSSFSDVGPTTHARDPEVSPSLGNDRADFEDVVPASNFDVMDLFEVENEGSSDLAQKPSGFCLETPQGSDLSQSPPTPNSNCDSPGVQAKVIVASGTNPENEISTPHSFLSNPYDTCFGMVSDKPIRTYNTSKNLRLSRAHLAIACLMTLRSSFQ